MDVKTPVPVLQIGWLGFDVGDCVVAEWQATQISDEVVHYVLDRIVLPTGGHVGSLLGELTAGPYRVGLWSIEPSSNN